MRLNGNPCVPVSPHLHAEMVFVARLEHMSRGVDEKLCVPCVERISDGMDFHAACAVIACSVYKKGGELATSVSVLPDEAGGIVSLTVSVDDPVFPCVYIVLFAGWLHRHATVSGVHQHRPFRDIDADIDGAAEQLAVLAQHGRLKPAAGEFGGVVGGFGRRRGCPSPFLTAISRTGKSGAAHGLGVSGSGHGLEIGVTQYDGAPIAVQRERSLVGLDVVRPKPHNLEPTRRHGAHSVGHLPQPRIRRVVAQVHAVEPDILASGVIEFYPAVEIGGRTHHSAQVGRHNFVDD